MMNRVKKVKALPGYRLELVFRNGEQGVFDKVVADHGTVMWPDGSDLLWNE